MKVGEEKHIPTTRDRVAQHNNRSLGFGTLTHVLGVLSITLSQFAIGWWLMIDASVAHEVKG